MSEHRPRLTEQELEEFDRLYDGLLSEGEYYQMKARLQADTALQHKYLVYRMLRREIRQDAANNHLLKERFAALERTVRRRRLRDRLAILVAICLLGAFLYVRWNRPASGAELYERYADSESGLAITMNEGSENDLNRAMVTLAEGRFSEALVLLQDVQAPDTAQYYRAYCQERMGSDSSALVLYQSLRDAESRTIRDKSRFRAALLHLKSGDARAEAEMRAVADDRENAYRQLATEILSALK